MKVLKLVLRKKEMKAYLKFSVLALILLTAPLSMLAQGEAKPYRFIDHVYVNLGVGTTTDLKSSDHGLSTLNIDASVGYFVLPQLYVYGKIEGGKRFFGYEPVKVYNDMFNLGGGLGWRFHKSPSLGSFDWRTDVTFSSGDDNWANNAYSTGVYWKVPSCRMAALTFGLGYTYYHNKLNDGGDSSKGGIRASIGFSF